MLFPAERTDLLPPGCQQEPDMGIEPPDGMPRLHLFPPAAGRHRHSPNPMDRNRLRPDLVIPQKQAAPVGKDFPYPVKHIPAVCPGEQNHIPPPWQAGQAAQIYHIPRPQKGAHTGSGHRNRNRLTTLGKEPQNFIQILACIHGHHFYPLFFIIPAGRNFVKRHTGPGLPSGAADPATDGVPWLPTPQETITG